MPTRRAKAKISEKSVHSDSSAGPHTHTGSTNIQYTSKSAKLYSPAVVRCKHRWRWVLQPPQKGYLCSISRSFLSKKLKIKYTKKVHLLVKSKLSDLNCKQTCHNNCESTTKNFLHLTMKYFGKE